MSTDETRAAARALEHWLDLQTDSVRDAVERCRLDGLTDRALTQLLLALGDSVSPSVTEANGLIEAAQAEHRAHAAAMVAAAKRREAQQAREMAQQAATRLQHERDARCIRYRHHEREIDHCDNPRCPALNPEAWTDFSGLQALIDRE